MSGITKKLRRDHAPFRGQLAKARRAVRQCAALEHEGYMRDLPQRPGEFMPGRDWQRRMLWHRAWEEYGNKLGKEIVNGNHDSEGGPEHG